MCSAEATDRPRLMGSTPYLRGDGAAGYEPASRHRRVRLFAWEDAPAAASCRDEVLATFRALVEPSGRQAIMAGLEREKAAPPGTAAGVRRVYGEMAARGTSYTEPIPRHRAAAGVQRLHLGISGSSAPRRNDP